MRNHCFDNIMDFASSIVQTREIKCNRDAVHPIHIVGCWYIRCLISPALWYYDLELGCDQIHQDSQLYWVQDCAYQRSQQYNTIYATCLFLTYWLFMSEDVRNDIDFLYSKIYFWFLLLIAIILTVSLS